ncbi:MFS transporter [Pseudooceanicola nanhaiensis]|jgi:predicted MFS family arabinose efflux permease|uniref:MFS transporter n=1 Tax=Pseudooceanicola nanhaiensis TaxID=375761 RepID=A0A917T5B6_9RHOB|nr:MFS transporter [Pseudooceanicola nanhaiensis]GGM09807.1 MFS transporter [Pseudooceanicola nanhaiensis]
MRKDLMLLGLAYVLSQFYRSFLSVLTTPLQEDLGASADQLAAASGLWFLSFAAMQVPVGVALDRIGPRRTSGWLLLAGGGGGAAVFALATEPWHVSAAMALLGVGCAPVLMAAYYILARDFPAARFSTLAGLILGIGTSGSIFSSLPLVWAAEAIGWRASVGALALISAAVALGLLAVVRDPGRVVTESHGSLLDILKIPAMWAILPLMFVSYMPSGGFRGVWTGPYLAEVYGASQAVIGTVALGLGVAMICGTLGYGPAERLFKTRKWLAIAGNLLAAAVCAAMVVLPPDDLVRSAVMLAAICLLTCTYALIISHGRAFFPPHQIGRGVTLMNLCGMVGVGLSQMLTGRLHERVLAAGGSYEQAYDGIFLFYAVALTLGVAIYARAPDRTD